MTDFCRITGKSRALPKPHYFPILPPLSLADVSKLKNCRITCKSEGQAKHTFLPLILPKKGKCGNKPDQSRHHYEPVDHTNNKESHRVDKCRITQKCTCRQAAVASSGEIRNPSQNVAQQHEPSCCLFSSSTSSAPMNSCKMRENSLESPPKPTDHHHPHHKQSCTESKVYYVIGGFCDMGNGELVPLVCQFFGSDDMGQTCGSHPVPLPVAAATTTAGNFEEQSGCECGSCNVFNAVIARSQSGTPIPPSGEYGLMLFEQSKTHIQHTENGTPPASHLIQHYEVMDTNLPEIHNISDTMTQKTQPDYNASALDYSQDAIGIQSRTNVKETLITDDAHLQSTTTSTQIENGTALCQQSKTNSPMKHFENLGDKPTEKTWEGESVRMNNRNNDDDMVQNVTTSSNKESHSKHRGFCESDKRLTEQTKLTSLVLTVESDDSPKTALFLNLEEPSSRNEFMQFQISANDYEKGELFIDDHSLPSRKPGVLSKKPSGSNAYQQQPMTREEVSHEMRSLNNTEQHHYCTNQDQTNISSPAVKTPSFPKNDAHDVNSPAPNERNPASRVMKMTTAHDTLTYFHSECCTVHASCTESNEDYGSQLPVMDATSSQQQFTLTNGIRCEAASDGTTPVFSPSGNSLLQGHGTHPCIETSALNNLNDFTTENNEELVQEISGARNPQRRPLLRNEIAPKIATQHPHCDGLVADAKPFPTTGVAQPDGENNEKRLDEIVPHELKNKVRDEIVHISATNASDERLSDANETDLDISSTNLTGAPPGMLSKFSTDFAIKNGTANGKPDGLAADVGVLDPAMILLESSDMASLLTAPDIEGRVCLDLSGLTDPSANGGDVTHEPDQHQLAVNNLKRSPTQKRLQLSEKDKNPEFHTSKESSSSFASSSTSSVELMMGGVRGDGGNGGDAFSSAVQDHDSSSALLITDLCHQLPVISKTLLERYLEGLDYTGNKCMMSASQSARTSRDISEEPVESGYQTDMNNSPDFVKHHHYHDGSSLGMRHDTPDSSVGGAEGVMSHFRPEDEDDTMSRNHVIDRNMLNIGANHRHRPDLNVADNGLDCSAPSSSVAKTLLNKRNPNGKGGCHQRRFESGTGAADDEVIDDDGHSIATQGCNVYETHYIHDDPLNGVLVGRDGKPTSHAGNKRRLEMAKEATIITSSNGTAAVDPTVSHLETTQNLQDPQQAMEELKAIAMQGLATDSLDWDLVRTKLHCLAAITSTDTYPEIAEKPATPIVVLLQGRRAVFPCGAARSVLLGDSSFTLIDESGVRFFPARKSVVTRRMAELIATEEEEEEGGRDGMRGSRRQMTQHHGLRGDDHVQKQHQEQEREKKAPRAKYPEIRAFLARQRAQHLRRT